MRHAIRVAIALLCLPAAAWALESRYTGLTESHCSVVERHGGGSTREVCEGPAGFRLAVLSDDARATVNVMVPGGGEHPLDLWTVVSGDFSELGRMAEWRVDVRDGRLRPRALILPYAVYQDPEAPDRATSYRVVARITEAGACVTHRIGPGDEQGRKAREAADRAANRPCLEPE